tara:strand:- start:8 stop:1108 length:1101 start_codon:yes stop_codon:yes gene_type:complete
MNNIIFSPFDLNAKHGGAKILNSHKIYLKSKFISTSNYFEYNLFERILISKYLKFLPYIVISSILSLCSIRAVTYLIFLAKYSRSKIILISKPELSLSHLFLAIFFKFDTFIIHDCPSHCIDKYPISLNYGKIYLKTIINNSKNVKVVSKGMIEKYSKLVKPSVNVKFIIELGAISNKEIEYNYLKKNKNNPKYKKTIVMAGSGHLGGRIKLKDDELINILHLFGKYFQDYNFIITDLRYKRYCDYKNIIYTSWLDQDQLNDIFNSKCIGFAYDLTSPKFSEFAYLSFPTKIQYYLCQSTPFIYFGPRNSSVYSLLSSSDSGKYLFYNFSKNELKNYFDDIFNNYEKYSKNAKLAALDFFCTDNIK